MSTSLQPKDMKERISMIKAQLILQQPFFGVFVTNTDVIEEKTIPTAATDGVHIYYNEDFFKTLNDQEIKAILMHEVLHMVYFHCSKKRRLNRSTRRWNVAADYAINWEIDELNYKLPKGSLLDHKWRTMTVEQIYDKLPENPKEDSFDVHLEMPDDETVQEQMQDKIVSTYEATKLAGKIPASVERFVEQLRKARVPWQRLFARFVGSALAKDDYSFTRPNRRFLGQGIYLPGLHSTKVGTIAVAVDTSGSIGEKELTAFKAELAKLSALISEVIVMSCDMEVHTYEVIKEMSNFQKAVKFKGGGGTSFQPPFKKLAEKKVFPEVMIYLTDGYGDFPDKKSVPYPVIWVMTTDVKPPFGHVVHMDINK